MKQIIDDIVYTLLIIASPFFIFGSTYVFMRLLPQWVILLVFIIVGSIEIYCLVISHKRMHR